MRLSFQLPASSSQQHHPLNRCTPSYAFPHAQFGSLQTNSVTRNSASSHPWQQSRHPAHPFPLRSRQRHSASTHAHSPQPASVAVHAETPPLASAETPIPLLAASAAQSHQTASPHRLESPAHSPPDSHMQYRSTEPASN